MSQSFAYRCFSAGPSQQLQTSVSISSLPSASSTAVSSFRLNHSLIMPFPAEKAHGSAPFPTGWIAILEHSTLGTSLCPLPFHPHLLLQPTPWPDPSSSQYAVFHASQTQHACYCASMEFHFCICSSSLHNYLLINFSRYVEKVTNNYVYKLLTREWWSLKLCLCVCGCVCLIVGIVLCIMNTQ